MGWSIGWDNRWGRDIGYGVPAMCDYPKCDREIDRGLSYVCGGEEPYGGDSGCGLYFCPKHQHYHSFRNGDHGFFCKRCCARKSPYNPKPDVLEWVRHKLKDMSWIDWRDKHPDEVKEMAQRLRNEMNKNAQALGKLGGKARARKLTPARRKEIATKASHSRKKTPLQSKKNV